jgi:hypothetical protein
MLIYHPLPFTLTPHSVYISFHTLTLLIIQWECISLTITIQQAHRFSNHSVCTVYPQPFAEVQSSRFTQKSLVLNNLHGFVSWLSLLCSPTVHHVTIEDWEEINVIHWVCWYYRELKLTLCPIQLTKFHNVFFKKMFEVSIHSDYSCFQKSVHTLAAWKTMLPLKCK